MLSDEDMMKLPDDPWEAFVALERLARERLDELLADQPVNGNGNWDYELEYMGSVLGAAQVYGIDELSSVELPHVEDNHAGVAYRQFRVRISQVCTLLRLRTAQRLKKTAVAFDPATKAKLRHLLDQMRDAVDKEIRLTQRKRDALFSKIADLSREVDSNWSRVESYGALVIEVADAFGEAVDRLEPLRKWIDSIGAAFGKARRDQDDQARLPAPREPKRIEPPKRRAASQGDKKIDDEIPF